MREAQIEEEVEHLGTGDEITAPETLERCVDHAHECRLVSHGFLPVGVVCQPTLRAFHARVSNVSFR